MKPVTSIRLPDTLKTQLQALADADNRTLTNYIETILKQEVEKNMNIFRLDIYTYNAMEGVNPEVRTTTHGTPEDAEKHLVVQNLPYAYAVLSKQNPQGYAPCDWNGNFVLGGEWPKRKGTNGSHPNVVALRSAWSSLTEETRRRWNNSDSSMLEIASDVLSERFPEISGYSERLALAAHGRAGKQ